MCVELTPSTEHKGKFFGASMDGHLFYIDTLYNGKFEVIVRVRGGYEHGYTQEFKSIFEMKNFCDDIIREDKDRK